VDSTTCLNQLAHTAKFLNPQSRLLGAIASARNGAPNLPNLHKPLMPSTLVFVDTYISKLIRKALEINCPKNEWMSYSISIAKHFNYER
jgi:hypothetical protein